MSGNKSNAYQRIKQKPRCMCVECQFLRIVEDENDRLFSICANRKSKNFLTEVSLIFGSSCKIGAIENNEEE